MSIYYSFNMVEINKVTWYGESDTLSLEWRKIHAAVFADEDEVLLPQRVKTKAAKDEPRQWKLIRLSKCPDRIDANQIIRHLHKKVPAYIPVIVVTDSNNVQLHGFFKEGKRDNYVFGYSVSTKFPSTRQYPHRMFTEVIKDIWTPQSNKGLKNVRSIYIPVPM